MRLQLIAAVVAVVVGAPTGRTPEAQADGVLAMRGVYYKERATRVVQPMLDGTFDVGTDGIVTAHFLVDAITSASASSGAVGATAFTENRYEAGGSYTHELDALRLGAQARISTESDYTSYFAGARGEVDLAHKNATLGLGFGVGRDRITAAGAQGLAVPAIDCSPTVTADHCALSTVVVFASASQVLSKNMVAGVTYDLARLDGYQSNPYRLALTQTGLAAERHPTERLRQAWAASLRLYVPRSKTTLIGAYRYYRDNWKIDAHTPELRIVQAVGRTADASVRYRFHSQDRAFFYRDRYATSDISMQRYLSDDVKLDAFRGHLIEAKLGIAGETFALGERWARARFEGILQYVLQHPRFGNAIVAHIAVTVPFDY